MSVFKVNGSMFKLPNLAPSPVKLNAGPKAFSAPRKNKKGPLKLGPEVFNTFARVVDNQEAIKQQRIVEGTLDKWGNPLGTEYWDPNDPKTKKSSRALVGAGGRPRRKISTGMVFGELTIIRKGPKVKDAARANLKERWRVQCSCGRQLIVPKYYLLRKPNPKTHCGHLTQTIKSQHPFEYRVYMMIHQRIFNPKHQSYEHYKSRGITLYEEWNNEHKDGFKKFLEHVSQPPVGPWPGRGYTLDRVHNSRGYEPGNLRWADASQQRLNQGDRIGGYTSEEIADLGYTEDEFIQKIINGEIQ